MMASISSIASNKMLKLNCSEGNSGKDRLSITLSNAIYIQSMNDKNNDEIANDNNNQFVKLTENTQSSESNNSLKLYQFTDKVSQSHIEPIDISSTYTIEELDEKRENERVYEYLLRLTEVRNWLKECLNLDDIANEIDFERNLSNGVLLARLAHSFAPHIAPLSKIFDFDQDGQVCYRHTDNISLWKDAIRSINFPE
uniref:Calponin-homology (CH) domain-containing protein n=1 Tax=Elaeophora elaphi TaxID=1147741 RepID=A0A0R3RNY3_9BILA